MNRQRNVEWKDVTSTSGSDAPGALVLADEQVQELGLDAAVLLAFIEQRGHERNCDEQLREYTVAVGPLVDYGYLTDKRLKRAIHQLVEAGILHSGATLVKERTLYCALVREHQTIRLW